MVMAYVMTQEGNVVIEVDFIPNESGIDKEMPSDLGFYVRNAVEKIGTPFLTFRTLPNSTLLKTPAGITLPQVQRDQTKAPQAAYKIVGSLQRASERVQYGNDARADGLFGGGRSQTDAQVTGEHQRTGTTLTLALNVEKPDGLAVPGGTAVYRIAVERTE